MLVKKFIFSATVFSFVTFMIPTQGYSQSPSQQGISARVITSHDDEILFQLMEERKPQVIVETGAYRENFGLSTLLIWGNWAMTHGAQVYAMGIPEEYLPKVQKMLHSFQNLVHLSSLDANEALDTFEQPIDMLYLNSIDSEPDCPCLDIYLQEIMAAEPKLSDKCIILFDKEEEVKQGKFAVDYLHSTGWRKIASPIT